MTQLSFTRTHIKIWRATSDKVLSQGVTGQEGMTLTEGGYLRYWKGIIYCEGSETSAQAAQRSCRCSIPEVFKARLAGA